MFAVQNDWPDASRKRNREDEFQDIATGGTLGFTEHRSKRLQALPLRITEPSKKWPRPPTLPSTQQSAVQQSLPRTITPGDSDSEDVARGTFRHDGQQTQQQQQGCGGTGVWADANLAAQSSFYTEPELSPGEDMDMMMDAPEAESQHIQQPQQQQQQSYLQPGSLQPDATSPPSITDRMPTPLQPNFASQVRGGTKNWGGAAGNMMNQLPAQRTSHMDTASGNQVPMSHSLHESPSRPRAGATSGINPVIGDWNLVQDRRLPSPISEGGGDDSDNSGSAMSMDISNSTTNTNTNITSPIYANAGFLPPPRASSAFEMAMGVNMSGAVGIPPRAQTPHVLVSDDGGMDVEATTPSPPRKGHMRSKHTVNNWTLQPGMKKSFSIGYRADCEKCKAKVPGHFNHIIISQDQGGVV